MARGPRRAHFGQPCLQYRHAGSRHARSPAERGTMGRVKRSRLLAACGVPVLAVAAAVSSAVAPSAADTAAGTAAVPDVPVTHVIEVMLENHSFDNLFGSFGGADGIPANTSLLNQIGRAHV